MNQSSLFRAQLRTHLLQALGVASALTLTACSQSDSGAGDGGGGAGGGGGGGGGGTTTTSQTTSGGTSSTSSTNTMTGTTSSSTTDTTTTSTSSTTTPTGMNDVERCFFIAADQMCPATADAAMLFGTCTEQLEAITEWLSGPTAVNGTCCYQVNVTAPNDPSCGLVGRPFVVEGQVRVAPISKGRDGWTKRQVSRRTSAGNTAKRATADMSGLDPSARQRLGQMWARDAAFEHASVASFGKLALELMAFGAPSDLVRAAHQAALDEVGHAEMGFALASAYLDEPVSPASLPEARSIQGAASLAELAVAALEEGCFGETMAAVAASAQRDAASDPAVVEALSIITEEESRHAELGFRIVAWALSEGGPAVKNALQKAFVAQLEAFARPQQAGCSAEKIANSERAHGRLSNSDLANERHRAVEEVVIPALSSLLFEAA